MAVAIVVLSPPDRGSVAAQTILAASPGASPSPSPTPPPVKKASRLRLAIESYTEGVNQQFVGPGVNGAAEIPNFQAGGPLAPAAPYDFFSGAPTTTGEGISQDLIVRPTFALTDQLDLSASFGYGSIGGSGNVAGYWGDSLMPTINPHLGSQAVTINPFFATHNGQDSVNATRVSVLDGSLLLHDGRGALVAGWFDVKQTVPFVFLQAPQPNTPFQLVPQTPQSIGDGTPSVDVFKGIYPYLKLHGYDAWGTIDGATIEVTNADLPAPPGTMARESSLSGTYAAGQLKISAEIAHLAQSGDVSSRVLFGSSSGSPFTLDGAAVVPFTSVTGQRMTVEGAGAAFPLFTADAEVRYGHSCYTGDGVAVAASSCTPGNYYYAKFHQGFSKFDLALEFVRFEPEYAPALLPYGTIENTWSAPFAFPGTWLHQDYQFVDNSEVGANRQGIRASTTFLIYGVETRIAVARYGQVSPYDLTTGTEPGFVEPYFSPQLTSTQGTRGTETHASIWLAAHPKIFDVTLELSDVVTNRVAPAGRPQDAVAVDYPSYVLSLSRTFGRILAGVGGARYGINGSYGTTGVANADLAQNIVFAGLQYRANANTAYGLQYQLFSVDGSPVIPGTLSPAYHGPQIQFYQRLKT
jgi:hypothetical protein